MKVVLPVAGAGTRLRPHTLTLPKCLLPVAGNTILGHILDAMSALPISEYIFITGYQAEKVHYYISKHYAHLPHRFVEQQNPQGLGEAIYLCDTYLQGEEPVLIVLGDTLFEADLQKLCTLPGNTLCTRKVEDPRRFGVAVSDAQGHIVRLVEKPEEFVSDQALVGIYFIRAVSELRAALANLIKGNIRTRGEFQLTDALQTMIADGIPFRTGSIQGWLDCGKPETLLETNRHLLIQSGGNSKDCYFKDSTIVQPCYIAPGVHLENCIVGPHVSLHKGCRLSRTVLRDSVVAGHCILEDCNLDHSILGSGAVVRRFSGSLNLGDHSAVNPED